MLGCPPPFLVVLHGLEPGWLGVSFGLRTCYVRIIMTRYVSLKKEKQNIYFYVIPFALAVAFFSVVSTLMVCLIYTSSAYDMESIVSVITPMQHLRL